jgi:Ca2+-binding EF-hand superfamily protein
MKEEVARMLFAVLLVSAAQAAVPQSTPIVVKGHVWAPFISPMGEPFRPHGADDDTLADWFHQADRNHDGVLTLDEMIADADRFFATLDTDRNGEIDPDELAHYEWEVAPDIQVMSKRRRAPGQSAPAPKQIEADGGHERGHDRQRHNEEDASLGIGGALQGAARYSLLNIPEPVAAADTDFNRGVSRDEFRAAAVARFQLLDSAHQGRLTLTQLEALLPAAPTAGRQRKHHDNQPDARIGNPLPPGN